MHIPAVPTPFACPLCNNKQTVFYWTDKKNHQHTYYYCSLCDVVFVIPPCRLDRATEKSRYDMHQNDNSKHYINFLSRLANPMLSCLCTPSVGLDFGSGKSQAMASLFQQAGHHCHCYDSYYYPDKSCLTRRYDFIVASEVIEHLYDPKNTFELWLDLLKPQGLLGIMTGFRPNDKYFANWWYKNDPTHVVLFSDNTFAYLQKTYGLAVAFSAKNIIGFWRP